MKKIGKVMATLLALAGVVSFMSCASDGGGSGSAVTEYSGSFSVGGKDFSSLNIKSDGTYTMIGEDGNDSGTWTLTNDDSQRASAASEGTYEFTSSKLGGSFTVEVTQTSISLSAGTIEAKGSGVISNSSDAITAKLPASVGTNELTGKKFVREETKKRSHYTSYEKETLAFNSNGTAQVTDYYKYEPTEEAIAEGDRAEVLNGFIDFNYSWNANDKLLYMAYVSLYAESTNKKISIADYVKNLSEVEAAETIKHFLTPEVYRYEIDEEGKMLFYEYWTGNIETCAVDFEYDDYSSDLEIEIENARLKIEYDADEYAERVAYIGVPIFDAKTNSFTAVMYKRTLRECTKEEIESDMWNHYSSSQGYWIDVYSNTPVGTVRAAYSFPTEPTWNNSQNVEGTLTFTSIPSAITRDISSVSENYDYTVSAYVGHCKGPYEIQ